MSEDESTVALLRGDVEAEQDVPHEQIGVLSKYLPRSAAVKSVKPAKKCSQARKAEASGYLITHETPFLKLLTFKTTSPA